MVLSLSLLSAQLDVLGKGDMGQVRWGTKRYLQRSSPGQSVVRPNIASVYWSEDVLTAWGARLLLQS